MRTYLRTEMLHELLQFIQKLWRDACTTADLRHCICKSDRSGQVSMFYISIDILRLKDRFSKYMRLNNFKTCHFN